MVGEPKVRRMTTDLAESFSETLEFWRPRLIAECNNRLIKIARLKGKYIWHKNENKDQVYIILSGMLLMDFRNGSMVKILPGELVLTPRGFEHLPRTNDEDEVLVILIEFRKMKHAKMDIKKIQNLFKKQNNRHGDKKKLY